ncbi:hypothetical protein H4683_003798 [Filibacter limicola]|uniref:Uncharacterized protein n=1 Tax=Sporosarcina limicola TaxID=34101 RepID=A0A927MP33_9BACL|nr:hypothetical protein [Sporosarcina limicola]
MFISFNNLSVLVFLYPKSVKLKHSPNERKSQQHLVEDGLFIFDTRNPLLHELAAVDEYEQNYIDKDGNDIVEFHRDEYDSMTQILYCHTDRQIYQRETLIAKEQDGISLRYSFPLEMEKMLKDNGLIFYKYMVIGIKMS